jgi:hypothetical protein
MIALFLFAGVVLVLGLFGLLSLKGAVIRMHRTAVVRAERLIRTIRTEANKFDRMDSVLSGTVIDLINQYDSDKLEDTK